MIRPLAATPFGHGPYSLASMEPVLYEERDGVATITLNRPDVFNSISRDLSAGVRKALEHAHTNGARAVVLTANGRGFCAGADLKELEGSYQSGAPELGAVVDESFNPLLHAIAELPLPVIAAVNGAAAGAGLGLALACDLRIASSAATFMMAFVNIGLVPDTGTSWLLPAAVGYSRAIEMAFSGRRIDANEALATGLVHRIAEPDALATEAHAWAAKLATGPTLAFARTKAIMRRAVETDLRTAADTERDEQDSIGRSADHLEGVQAFLAKRPPVYKGR